MNECDYDCEYECKSRYVSIRAGRAGRLIVTIPSEKIRK